LDTGNLMVTEDVTLTIGSLKLAAKTGNSGNTTTLNVVPGAVLTANGAISLGANTIITGTGTLVANGAISGGGKITASSGLLDLEGSGSIASGGAALAIGTAVPSTLELNLTGGITASSVAISSAFQTLLIGAAGSVTFTATEKVVNGTVQMAGGTLTDASGINLGSQTASGTLSGFGTVAAAISRSGTGVANLVTAIGGLLDLKGNVTGIGLAIDALAPARLMLEGTVSTPTAIAISSPNQTLEIGPSGKLTIQAAETATNGTIQLDGGALVDTAGITIGSGATLTGFGSVSGGLAGTGVVKARGGVLDLLSGVTSTATTFVIDPTPGSVLELAGAASLGTTFTFAGPSGKLELADIVNGVVQGFNGTIAGLNIGASASVPTNAVNIRTTVTSATLSGNAITVSNGGTTVATLRLSSAQPAGTRAVIAADATLGGYDVFLAPAAPTVSWSPNAKTGVEGQTIALGTIVPASGNPLQSVTVSGIPAGATLSDGVNSFAATSGNTSTNIIGWNYAALTLTPSNDTNATLTAQVTDTGGNTSAPATETVTVTPLAPGVAPVAVSGSAGQPIPLNLGLSVNGLTGDANTLSTVTISNIPSGATLSN
ncbi:MAG: hypothetical protein J2P17_29995, partial [Mycobacterium sp.]|nr:hypothetical protein [Mycobacterium sp.]